MTTFLLQSVRKGQPFTRFHVMFMQLQFGCNCFYCFVSIATYYRLFIWQMTTIKIINKCVLPVTCKAGGGITTSNRAFRQIHCSDEHYSKSSKHSTCFSKLFVMFRISGWNVWRNTSCAVKLFSKSSHSLPS